MFVSGIKATRHQQLLGTMAIATLLSACADGPGVRATADGTKGMAKPAAANDDTDPKMTAQNAVPDISYNGVEAERLDDDLVQINVRLKGKVDNDNVAAYAECAAAQYTLSRGYGFARHIMTNVKRANSNWTGKSVYWVSKTLPDGLVTIDAAVTAKGCFENGIPTV